MIEFFEHPDKTEIRSNTIDLTGKSKENIEKQVEASNEFWDNLISDGEDFEELSEEELFHNIFGIEESQFEFSFDENEEITDIMEQFQETKWEELSKQEKETAVGNLETALAKDLNLTKIPEIEYYEGAENDCGSYNVGEDKIKINSLLLNDTNELIDTVAHELRHAYQHEHADKVETFTDFLYKVNFDNYISPIFLANGKCLFFVDYYNQFVEAEARAYANALVRERWKNE